MLTHAVTPILNVSDVPASLRWFEKLGWHRGFTWNPAGTISGAALQNAHGPATFARAADLRVQRWAGEARSEPAGRRQER
jgi:hypothetical protein